MSITKRIDNTVRMAPESFSVTPPAPHAVKIDLMRTCNYRCQFCYHSKLKAHTGAMDWDLYLKLLDDLQASGVQEVAPFFFGESFLHPRLPDAIREAKARFPYVFLTTNGSVATPKKVEACMQAGLDSLKFSLNYADAAQMAEIARVPESFFGRVIQNIKGASIARRDGGYSCKLYASYIQFDNAQAERMASLLEIVRPLLDEVYALPLYNQAAHVSHDGWEFSGGNQGRADNPVPPVPCWALFREGHVNYDGTLCACCFSVGDEFTMGDLNKQSFMEAWHSPKFQALRQKHLDGDIRGTPCEGCVVQKRSDT